MRGMKKGDWIRILVYSSFSALIAGVGFPFWVGIISASVAFGITFAILVAIESCKLPPQNLE